MNNDITEYISTMVDNIDNLMKYLENIENQRELDVAKQKLEEAVFWLTYWLDMNTEDEGVGE